jgi:lysyl-tRNA synthetase, class II
MEQSSEDHRLIAERKRKLEELRAAGINPYPYGYSVSAHAKEVKTLYERLQAEEASGDVVSLAGRIMLLRKMGKMAFGHIQDETGRIQIWLRADVLGEKFDLHKFLDIGDFIGVKGEAIKTKTGEVTILVKEFEILTKSLRPLPEKYHGLKDEEERFRRRYLDLVMNPDVKDIFVKRARIIQSVRETLLHRGFLEVETPTLQTMYGGANARPFITHINAWDMKMFLSVAPELYLKRLLVGGYEKVFTICKNFRNEGVDQTHNPEFTMMECYQAYGDYNTMMEITEELYENACKVVHGGTQVVRNGITLDFKRPWPRITMNDAIRQYAHIDVNALSDAEMRALVAKHTLKATQQSTRGEIILALFEHFCEEHLIQPTHVIDHPIESTPLCKTLRSGDTKTIERFESFIMGKEICNAYTELNDPVLQRQLLEDQAAQLRAGAHEAHPMDEDFVQAIEYGMPPAGGLGVGIDRMIIMLLGVDGIRDVILFPTMRPERQSIKGEQAEDKA